MDINEQWIPLFSSGEEKASWQAQHTDLFPSDQSLRHWFRAHKAQCVGEGAVAFHRGRYMATGRLVDVVHRIAGEAAARVFE